MRPATFRAQSGATLVVGLIMLVLITLLVITALTMSTANLKAVGNMQIRNEAIAAANQRIEEILSTAFATTPPATTAVDVDINQDGQDDFAVDVTTTCMQVLREAGGSAGTGTSSSTTLGLPSVVAYYNTLWDIRARANSTDGTGGQVEVHQGVRVRLSQTQCNLSACGPCN